MILNKKNIVKTQAVKVYLVSLGRGILDRRGLIFGSAGTEIAGVVGGVIGVVINPLANVNIKTAAMLMSVSYAAWIVPMIIAGIVLAFDESKKSIEKHEKKPSKIGTFVSYISPQLGSDVTVWPVTAYFLYPHLSTNAVFSLLLVANIFGGGYNIIAPKIIEQSNLQERIEHLKFGRHFGIFIDKLSIALHISKSRPV